MLNEVKDYITQGDGAQWDRLPKGIVALHVTHSNLNRRMIEIRFDLHMKIGDLKDKLHKHCGTPGFSQKLILKDGGQAIAHLDDDSKMLGYYSAESGMEIHVIDTDPFSMSRGGGLEDESLIQKYRMTDEDYDQRKGTVREHIRTQKALDPNWKPPKPNMINGNPWQKAPAQSDEPPPDVGPETVAGMEVGMRCEVTTGGRRGEVCFVGEVPELSGAGHWVGVRFDEPVGKSNGTAKGKRYFECNEHHGGWVRGFKLQVGDFPEREFNFDDSDDEDEI